MGPKKRTESSSPSKRPSNRLTAPVPYSSKHAAGRGGASSPHDTLAETSNRKGTGYFLQFSTPAASQGQLKSPRKRQSPVSHGYVSPRKSRIPVKSQGEREGNSKTVNISGTRTRSVSPKVLKKDDKKVEENLVQAVEICNQLQSKPHQRDDNSSANLIELTDNDTHSDNKTIEDPCRVDTSVSKEATQQKEGTIDSSASENRYDFLSTSIEHSSTGIVEHTINTIDNSFIDQNTSNIDKTRLSSAHSLSEPECDSVKDSHHTEDLLHTSELDTPDYTPPHSTIHDSDTQDTSEQTCYSAKAVHSAYHVHGCQELDLTDEEEGNTALHVNLYETERDSSVLDVNEGSIIADTCKKVEVPSSTTYNQPNQPQENPEELSQTQPAADKQQAAQPKKTMASSWMDRLKEVSHFGLLHLNSCSLTYHVISYQIRWFIIY